jgi:hypothetical protein
MTWLRNVRVALGLWIVKAGTFVSYGSVYTPTEQFYQRNFKAATKSGGAFGKALKLHSPHRDVTLTTVPVSPFEKAMARTYTLRGVTPTFIRNNKYVNAVSA